MKRIFRKYYEKFILFILKNKYNKHPLAINVLNIEDTLDFIINNHSSVSRFGDGEINIMSGESIAYQDYNDKLCSELKEIVSLQSNIDFVVCLSDVYKDLNRYTPHCQIFWYRHLLKYRDIHQKLFTSNWYGSTFISRPYMDLSDKSKSFIYFDKLKMLWNNRDILIVEGKNSRSGIGNDLFSNANSISRIICPSKNAYDKVDLIEKSIISHAENKLVLLMLGPTAKVLAKRISEKGIWAIDLGHIDSEYEWFKMGALEKVKLSYKHTAEHNFDEHIVFINDEEYNKQIIINLS